MELDLREFVLKEFVFLVEVVWKELVLVEDGFGLYLELGRIFCLGVVV